MDWRALDADLQAAGYASHAEIVAGLAPAPGSPLDPRIRQAIGKRGGATKTDARSDSGSDSEGGNATLPDPPPLPALSVSDWVRRGLLAERLFHDNEALMAYRAAVALAQREKGASGKGASSATSTGSAAAASGGGGGNLPLLASVSTLRLAADLRHPGIALAVRGARLCMHFPCASSTSLHGTQPRITRLCECMLGMQPRYATKICR